MKSSYSKQCLEIYQYIFLIFFNDLALHYTGDNVHILNINFSIVNNNFFLSSIFNCKFIGLVGINTFVLIFV